VFSFGDEVVRPQVNRFLTWRWLAINLIRWADDGETVGIPTLPMLGRRIAIVS
jgi:hypothetical protein